MGTGEFIIIIIVVAPARLPVGPKRRENPTCLKHRRPSMHLLLPTELSLRTTPANTTSSPTSTATTSQQRLSDLSAHFDPRTSTANMSTEAVGDFGLIGLAVMGQNLIMNAADHGFNVVAFNRTVSKVDRFLDNEAKGKSIVGAKSLEEFVAKLKKPRRMMMLVMAGKPVDDFIEAILAAGAEPGDIIIDGGNSHFPDTNRRTKYLQEKGIRFVGTGVSGGEEGARYGTSIMPGGNEEAWPYVKDVLQSISAKSDGEACCQWVGDEGAGHYVKMVHNGIEYGDVQLISEAYDIMKRGLGMSCKEIGDVFAQWNKGVLDSFLIEITRDIMYYNDEDGTPLVEKILDAAGQKGTGKWTAINALDMGQPVTLIGEAVFARCLSSLKGERIRASERLTGPTPSFSGNRQEVLDNLEQALYASKIISYTQGFMLMENAAQEYGWKLQKPQTGWRDIVSKGALWGIPTPAFSTALSFYDGFRTKPEFASQTYPEGKDIHVNWTGRGGNV